MRRAFTPSRRSAETRGPWLLVMIGFAPACLTALALVGRADLVGIPPAWSALQVVLAADEQR